MAGKSKKGVSNYETVLSERIQRHTKATPLRLRMIVAIQNLKGECEVGERGIERGAVRVERSWIHLQSSCARGRGTVDERETKSATQ
jgi:hypothetical protein